MSLAHALMTSLLEKSSSGYDLARRFDKSIGFFWHATHQQIYRELGRMEKSGWIRSDADPDAGRTRKRSYSVLPAGRLLLAAIFVWGGLAFAIYPIAVVGGTESEVTFNQGGETVQVGRIYRLVSLGQNLVDPYTRESLGQEEREVARAEVISVTDRTATAKVVSGRLPQPLKAGSVLARVLPEEVSGNVSVQLTMPVLPGMSAPAVAGKGPRPKPGRGCDGERTWSK